MASGKKNYFRHSANASEDPKLQELMLRENLGKAGYFYYFSLLELMRRESDEETITEITVHRRTLCTIWKTNENKLKRILNVLEKCSTCFVKHFENSVSISVPSFGKYCGDTRKKVTEKSKEEKSKVKERKPPKPSRVRFEFETLYQKYPRKEGKKKGIEKIKKEIKTQEQFDQFSKAIKNYSAHCIRESIERRFIKQFSSFVSSWEDWVEYEIEQTHDQKFASFLDSVGN